MAATWQPIGQIGGQNGSPGRPGEPGPRGRDAPSFLTGTADPTTSLGIQGDFYVQAGANIVWRKQGVIFGAPPQWTKIASIKGDKGDRGKQGDPGPPGASIEGQRGDRGDSGLVGSTGATGDPGRPNIGPVGPRGNDGNKWLLGSQLPQPSQGILGDLYFQTSQLTTGPVLLKGDQGPPGLQGPQGAPGPLQPSLGYALFVPFPAINWVTASNSADNGFAILCYVSIPSPMWLHSLGVDVNTGNSGTVQWGLFDYTASPSSARKVAGGTGTLATGYGNIAATGGPIFLLPGSYAAIYLCAAANTPTINKTNLDFSTLPIQKSQGAYVWTDTPNLTTGWANDGTLYNLALHGQLSSSSGKY